MQAGSRRSFRSLAAALALAGAVGAQTIDRVTPQVASPGATVIIEGSGLGQATDVSFTAFVGGFVGVWTVDVPVTSASNDRVTAVVPPINAFIPPGQQQGGSPFGELRVEKNAGFGPFWQTFPADFYFLEGTGKFLENGGLGSTQSSGDRAVVSFDPGPPVPSTGSLFKALGPNAPTPGNATFTPRVEAAVPGSLPILFVGAPGPSLPIGDGVVVIDPGNVYVSLAAPPADVDGDSSTTLPVPAGAAGFGTVVLQWALVDGFALNTSNALRIHY